MLLDITDVTYLSEYKLLLTFESGEKRVVDLKHHLIGPIFQPLKELDAFKKVYVDHEQGTIV